MTDEQWLWLFANQSLDADEKLENMCPDCRREVAQHRCIRCGKLISGVKDDEFEESFTNDNFDIKKYEAMKNGTYELHESEHEVEQTEPDNGNVDMDLVQQILSDGR